MNVFTISLIGLVAFPAGADSRLEGRVLSPSGDPAAGAQVLLFDLTDLRAAPLAATTDRSGRFTLPLSGAALPQGFELGSNYPNPFNPSTIIPYQLPASMHVRLEVFNLLGQRIATLVDGERRAGAHTAEWDATDAAGQAVGAGVYLYRLSGEGAKITRRMLLIDGQAGIAGGRAGSSGVTSGAAGGEEAGEAPIYGLTVSGPGLVPYVDPALRVEAGLAPVEVVLEAPGPASSAKAASSGGILGDVDNTGGVDFFDALLVALYSQDSRIVMPNNGVISLGDVNADGRVDLADAWLIAAWLNDPSDPSLPAGIGQGRGSGRVPVPGPRDGDVCRRRGLAPVHGGGARAGFGGGQPRGGFAEAGDLPRQGEQLLPGRSRRRRLSPGRPVHLLGRVRGGPGHGGAAAAIGRLGPADLHLRGDGQPGGSDCGVGRGQ